MHGFKSFARRTEIVFENSYNCILGPNGAGKSNVLDAICFVLGKGSVKGLRAEKSANLIYNGGKTRSPAKFGEVSIFFDNSKKEFPLECDEIKITRIVKRNGQSVYRINDETKTRQQVLELLSIAKINPDGYNIILQGDIATIVDMPPVERRKLIEEIAGISVYEEKKQKALRELEKVENKLQEAQIILAERKAQLKELKSDRDQALRFKKLKEQIDSNKASYIKIQIEKQELKKTKFEKLRTELNKKKEKLEQKISDITCKIKEYEKEIDKINREIELKGNKKELEVQKEIENLKIKIAKNESSRDNYNNELEKIAERKNQLDRELDDINKRIEDINQEIKSLNIKKESNLKDQQVLSKKIADFKNKHKLDNLNEFEQDLERIDSEFDKLQEVVQALRERQQGLLREKDKIEYQISTIDEKINKVKQVEQQNKNQLKELKNKKTLFKQTTIKLNSLLNDTSSLGAQLHEHRRKLNELRERLSKLEAKNASVKEFLAAGEAIKQVLANKSRFPGVYGLLSELGKVKSKYAMALEIAAGSKIKNIIVDSDATASKCIKFLKDKKLGTASFIPLNKIRSPSIDPSLKKLRSVNGVHDFAINLIKFEPKFKKAFEYVFGNTLVVENIDVARRIGVGTLKMVTIDGDVAEISGVMRGGYRQKQRQISFKQDEVTDEIETITEQIANTESNIKLLEARKSEKEEEVQKLRELKANLEGEIIKLEKSLHLESGDLELNKARKKDLQKELNEINSKLSKLNSEVLQKTRELADKKIEKQKLRETLSKLKNPRQLAELNTFQGKLAELKEEINKIDADINAKQNMLKTVILKERENLLKKLKQLDKEEHDFKQNIIKLEKEIETDKKLLEAKEREQEKFYTEFKSKFEKRNKITDLIKDNNDKILQLNQEIEKVDRDLNNLAIDKARLEGTLASLYEDFKQYEGVKVNTKKSEALIRKEINEFERMLEDIGNVNMRALEVYDSVEKEYNDLVKKKSLLESEKKEIHKMMDEIEGKKKAIFMKTFEVLRTQFKEMFSKLSTKGNADLVLENPSKPFEGGVLINVRLSGNKYLDIRSLSGGEKSLTALAFIFAIQEHEPASFYVLDEVDAALDKQNSEKLAKLIRKYSEKAQYIVISHNDSVISEADYIYGVSIDEHEISKVVSLKV